MSAVVTDAPSRRLKPSLAFFGLGLIHAYLLLYGGTTHALLNPWAHAIVRLLGLGVCLLGALLLLQRDRIFEGLGMGVDGAAILFAVVAGATTATAADAFRSWESVGLAGAYGVTLYLVVNWCRSVGTVYPLAVLLGFGNILVCLSSRLIPWVGHWLGFDLVELPGYLIFPLGNWNLTGSYLLLTSPILVGLAAERSGKGHWLWWGAVALALVTVLQSGSRIAVLITMAELVLAGLAFLVRGRGVGRAVLTLLVVAFAVGALFEGSGVWERLAPLSDTGADVVSRRALSDESVAQRLDIWRGAWSSWHWLGNGLNSVPVQFGEVLLQSPRFPDLSTPNLHNTYLNLLYEMGLPGLLAMVLLLALIVNAALVSATYADGEAALIQGGVWGLVGYSASLLVVFHAHVPVMPVTAALVAALCLGHGSGPEFGKARHFFSLNLLLSVGAFGIPFGTSAYSFWHYDRALELWDRERGPALEHLREGVIYNPLELFPRFALGMALAQQPSRADQEEGLQQLAWVNVRSQLPVSFLAAGIVALRLGEPTRAVTGLEGAVRLRYYSGSYHFWLAQAYLANQDSPAAVGTMARALVYSPVLLDAALWQHAPWQGLRDEVLDHAILRAQAQLATRPRSADMSYRLGRLLSAKGRQEDARSLYTSALSFLTSPDPDQQPGLSRNIAYAMGDAWARQGQDDQAAQWWSRARRADPRNPAAVWALGHYWQSRSPETAAGLLQEARNQFQAIGMTLPDTVLRQGAGWERYEWDFPIERQESWFLEAFQRPAPPFLGASIRLRAAALAHLEEWEPWIYLPKTRAGGVDPAQYRAISQ